MQLSVMSCFHLMLRVKQTCNLVFIERTCVLFINARFDPPNPVRHEIPYQIHSYIHSIESTPPFHFKDIRGGGALPLVQRPQKSATFQLNAGWSIKMFNAAGQCSHCRSTHRLQMLVHSVLQSRGWRVGTVNGSVDGQIHIDVDPVAGEPCLQCCMHLPTRWRALTFPHLSLLFTANLEVTVCICPTLPLWPR